MRDQYLIRRGKGWAFRLAIPADLRGKFKSAQGKPLSHIVIGLGTDSLADARVSRDKLVAEWRVKFERASAGLELGLPEIDEQAREIYLSRLEAMADAAERGKAPQVDDGEDSSTQNEREINALDLALEQFLEAQEDDDFSLIALDITAIQRRTKVSLDPNGKTYSLLCEAIMSAHIAALAGRINMLRGKASEPPATFLGSEGIDPVTLQPITNRKAQKKERSASGNSLRFSEAAAMWLAELQRDPNAAPRPSTIKLHEKIHRFFIAAENDPSLETVTRKTASEFLRSIGLERKLSNRSLKQYAGILSSVFKWGA